MAVIVDGQANTLGVGRRYILVRIEVVFNTYGFSWHVFISGTSLVGFRNHDILPQKNIGADPKKKNINEVTSDSYHPRSGE